MVKLLIVLCAIIVAGMWQRKKVHKIKSNWKQYGWLCLHSLIPLMVYYLFEITTFDSFIAIDQDMGKVVLKTPFLYFFFFSFIWLLSYFRKGSLQMPIIIPLVLLPLSFMGVVGSVFNTDTMSKTSFVTDLTPKEREIIKEQFQFILPESVHEVSMYDSGGWQDRGYSLEFELPFREFEELKKQILDKYEPIDNQYDSTQKYNSIKNELIQLEIIKLNKSNVRVVGTIGWLVNPNDDYLKFNDKNASVWNTIIRKGFFNVLF